jgi:hypothetical protein
MKVHTKNQCQNGTECTQDILAPVNGRVDRGHGVVTSELRQYCYPKYELLNLLAQSANAHKYDAQYTESLLRMETMSGEMNFTIAGT